METELPPQESEGKSVVGALCFLTSALLPQSMAANPGRCQSPHGVHLLTSDMENNLSRLFFSPSSLCRPLPGLKPAPRDMAYRR